MTRKEKIIQKAQELAKKAKPIAEHLPMSAIIAACVDMVEWTLNNIWHDASEEPELNSTVVIEWASDKHVSIAEFKGRVSYSKNRFRVQSDLGYSEISVSKWCYLDDILPDSK